MGVRTCGRVGVQMGVQKWMTVKKERKKEKKRKRKDSLVFRAGGWACGRVVDGRV